MAKMAKQVNKGVNDEERLVGLFGSTSRPRILGLLLADTGKAFYQREIKIPLLLFQTRLEKIHPDPPKAEFKAEN
jgi:hypothetical protein